MCVEKVLFEKLVTLIILINIFILNDYINYKD